MIFKVSQEGTARGDGSLFRENSIDGFIHRPAQSASVLDFAASVVQRWRSRLELANAIFEYLEVFDNRQRRHSALGMLKPIEYERLHIVQPVV